MKVGPELRHWLDDRNAQRRARERSDEFAIAWNQGSINALFTAATAGLKQPSAEQVAAAVRKVFEDDRAIDGLVAALANSLREEPYLEPPFRRISSEIHSGLLIFEDDMVSVAAGVTNLSRLAEKKRRTNGRGSIAFSGRMELLKFVKAGGARLSFWETPPITADFSAASAGRCRPTRERVIADGEIIVIDGRSESFVIEHASANLVVLQATVKSDQAPLSVEYDALSSEYVGCSAADDSASRIQMIATLLRKLGSAAAFPAIAEFLDHPNFFVRWHVMRELLGLDAEAALPHLKRMAAADPHPETRRAARAVVERFAQGLAGASKAA